MAELERISDSEDVYVTADENKEHVSEDGAHMLSKHKEEESSSTKEHVRCFDFAFF